MTDPQPKPKQFTLWQLMKWVAIAAFLTSALMPLFRKADEILANPGQFIAVMALVCLLQAPFLLLPNIIDWVLGHKSDRSSD